MSRSAASSAPDATILQRDVPVLADLSDSDCAATDGLMLFRLWLGAEDFKRFPKLRAVVRMGVGYDRIDRAAAARHGVTVCNVPDYGTTEVADHAISLALALRPAADPAPRDAARPESGWLTIKDPVIQRFSSQGFGIVGLGPHRHGGGAAGQGARLPRQLLRPETAKRGGTGARADPGADAGRRCWAAPTCCRSMCR